MRALLTIVLLIVSLRIPAIVVWAGTTADQPEKAETITIEHGTTTFVVETNMPGLTVKGKSEALQAQVKVRPKPEGVTLERIQAWLPVKTLVTGIAVRDQHMRQYVFTASSGEIPDVRFEGQNVSCPGILAGREATCKISGTLSIRGQARRFSMMLKVRAGSATLGFRASGDGLVNLNDYGIEAPSQFGVKTANQIHIHVELPEANASAIARQRQ